MNFTEVKSILERLTALAKTTATLDLHEKIVSLREFIIEIKDENIALKELYGDEATLRERIENLRATQPEGGDELIRLADKYLAGRRPRDFDDD